MDRRLKVLFVSSECDPYIKTGGLGDVAGALPFALKEQDVDVIRVMPLYSSVRCRTLYVADFPVYMGNGHQTCVLKQDALEHTVPTYFIGNDWYFNRDRIYGYYEDGERFLFFCRASVDMLSSIDFVPDVIHCNDWHTGLVPLIIRAGCYNINTVYTIHNLKYQGWITSNFLKENERNFLGYAQGINFMESGIMFSDYITTVSRGYAEEILSPEFGEGMEMYLNKRKDKLYGIMNGIDVDKINPDRQKGLKYPYSFRNFEGKKNYKGILRKEMDLIDEDVPIVGAVTRLDGQKGIDILIEALSNLKMEGFQFVILGTGDNRYEAMLEQLSRDYKGRMTAVFAFDSALAERIYAGSDIFVMPSKYEPGGLGQLYAMSYGTVPVVRHTGGLKDSVIDFEDNIEDANGFYFDEYSSEALIHALRRAVSYYRMPDWNRLIRNGMSCDRSWKKPAEQYINLYNSLKNK